MGCGGTSKPQKQKSVSPQLKKLPVPPSHLLNLSDITWDPSGEQWDDEEVMVEGNNILFEATSSNNCNNVYLNTFIHKKSATFTFVISRLLRNHAVESWITFGLAGERGSNLGQVPNKIAELQFRGNNPGAIFHDARNQSEIEVEKGWKKGREITITIEKSNVNFLFGTKQMHQFRDIPWAVVSYVQVNSNGLE